MLLTYIFIKRMHNTSLKSVVSIEVTRSSPQSRHVDLDKGFDFIELTTTVFCLIAEKDAFEALGIRQHRPFSISCLLLSLVLEDTVVVRKRLRGSVVLAQSIRETDC